MIKGNHLILTGENDIVFAYDCAAADRLNTNLLRITFLACSGTIVFVMVCIAHRLVDRICQRNRRTARSIHFLIVVLLQNLNIKSSRSQNLRCFFQKL